MARPARKKKRGRLKPNSPRVGGGYPFVAIVGRPNVGKSSLFNRILGQRLAITEDTAGTTRDRIAALVQLEDGRWFELCDTGGIGGTGDAFDKDVNRQIDLAMDYADVILFVVDARDGLMPHDEMIAKRIKKLDKPTLVVANKAETAALEAMAGEFYALGMQGDVLSASAREGTGKTDILETIGGLLPDVPQPGAEEREAETGRDMRVAIVGRRNAGKSTYVNRLLGEERVIASETAGTTRDAVDVRVTVAGRELVLIDTAGLRKRGKADDHIEIVSHGRARQALRRSDVALLFLDCLRDVGNVDKKIASMIREEHKACVIVANKWDLVGEGMTMEDYAEYAYKLLPNLDFCPMLGVSAKEGFHDQTVIKTAFELYGQSMVRVGTGELNRALSDAITLRRPRPHKGRLGKIFFGTQVATNPVTLLLFVNYPELFSSAYRRYLENQMRSRLPWGEIPVKLCFRSRDSLKGKKKRRVQHLEGLAEGARWVDDRPDLNVAGVTAQLDADEVRMALFDEYQLEANDEDVPEGNEASGD